MFGVVCVPYGKVRCFALDCAFVYFGSVCVCVYICYVYAYVCDVEYVFALLGP